jgi:hypothetical protein
MQELNLKLIALATFETTLKTKSTGIFDIFRKMKSEDEVDNKIEAIQLMAREKLEPRTGVAVLFRKRSDRMERLYKDLSYLDTKADNRHLLNEIHENLQTIIKNQGI